MKTFYVFVFLCISMLHADDWSRCWVDGLEHFKNDEYEKADYAYTMAIKELESKKDERHGYVYLDRAENYCRLERYLEALTDVNRAIDEFKVEGSDLKKAIGLRVIIDSAYEDFESYQYDIKLFKKLSGYVEPEFLKDKIIYRNMPNCTKAKKFLTEMMKATGNCNEDSDISCFPDGTWIVRRQYGNCCSVNQATIDNCREHCSKMSFMGTLWCSRRFKSGPCSDLCLGTVKTLEDLCYRCCANGDFYGDCIKPFENILQHIGNMCDPAWD